MSRLWLVVGFAGQALFSARFLVQWLASERRRTSVVPNSFWHLSVVGGLTLLAYALHRRDPVFIVGQLTGVFIYGRNLWFIHRPLPAAPSDVGCDACPASSDRQSPLRDAG